MKKEKLYDPEKTGTFKMMFGFRQTYMYANRKNTSGIEEVHITKPHR